MTNGGDELISIKSSFSSNVCSCSDKCLVRNPNFTQPGKDETMERWIGLIHGSTTQSPHMLETNPLTWLHHLCVLGLVWIGSTADMLHIFEAYL